MTLVSVLADRCKTHLTCLQACPVNAIDILDGTALIRENCIGCDACIKACPEHAIVPALQDRKSDSAATVVAILPEGALPCAALVLATRAAEATGANLVRVAFGGGSIRDAALEIASRIGGATLVVLPAGAPFDRLAGALGARLNASVFCNAEALTRFPDGRAAVEIETHGGRGYATFDIPAAGKLVLTVRSNRDTLVVLGDDAGLHAASLDLARVLGARSCTADALPSEPPRLLVIAGTSGRAQLAALAARAKGVVGFGIPRGNDLAAACDAVFSGDAVVAMRAFALAVP